MLKHLFFEYGSDVGNSECDIFGEYLAWPIQNLSAQEIEPVIAKLAAVFLPANKVVNEAFVFIIVEILDSLDGKVAHKLDSCFAVNIDILLNVDIDIIQCVNANELRYAYYYLIYEVHLRFVTGFHYLKQIINLILTECFL